MGKRGGGLGMVGGGGGASFFVSKRLIDRSTGQVKPQPAFTVSETDQQFLDKHNIFVHYNTSVDPNTNAVGEYTPSNQGDVIKLAAGAGNDTFQHEIGHAVMRRGILPKDMDEFNYIYHSKPKQLEALVTKRIPELKWYDGFTDSQLKGSGFNSLVSERAYAKSINEVFADGYRFFKTKPNWMQKNAPDFYNYYNSLKL